MLFFSSSFFINKHMPIIFPRKSTHKETTMNEMIISIIATIFGTFLFRKEFEFFECGERKLRREENLKNY